VTTKFPTWVGLPPEFFDLGYFEKLSDSGVRLYMALCWNSDRRSSRKFELDDRDVTKSACISERTFRDARKELAQQGLIVCDPKSAGRRVYTLCDPNTGLPYPGDPKAKIKPKSATAAPAPAPAAPVIEPADTEPKLLLRAEGVDLCDTDFPFGRNLATYQHASQPTAYEFDFA
jgi:hypothetical protein